MGICHRKRTLHRNSIVNLEKTSKVNMVIFIVIPIVQLLQGHEKTVLGIDNNEKRRLLASVSKDATCRVWSYKDADDIICVAVASGHAKSVIACAFSRLDGCFVVTGEYRKPIVPVRTWNYSFLLPTGY